MTGVPPLVSIVVPVDRDELLLAHQLASLDREPEAEVIVATTTIQGAAELRAMSALAARHPRVRWMSAPRGRGTQMNAGATLAAGEWLLFLHADCELPP